MLSYQFNPAELSLFHNTLAWPDSSEFLAAHLATLKSGDSSYIECYRHFS